MNAEILSVGTELLLGNTVNTDARDLSQGLADLGINVYWHTVVGDNPARLTECVYRARNRADLIVTTGGLGPTCDDLTKEILARSFGLELYYDQEQAQRIRDHFQARGRVFTDNNLRQAWLPQGCTVLHNQCGTAPGCAFEKDGVRVIMLPGPPQECREMFRLQAVPYLRALSQETIRSHQLRMFGVSESAMEARLRDLMEGANPSVAPYTREGECLVRVTAKGGSGEECDALMEPVLREIRARMGDYVYGQDCDSMEEMVLALLEEKGVSLAAAESCTGGLLAQRLTEIPGASRYFRGGVTVYTEQAKTRLLGLDPKLIQENGVVSAAVAAKLAKRVRKALKSDLGVGITGWAGPEGEDVGLVYVALACRGECYVRRLALGGRASRSRIRILAVNNAFDMIRRYLTGLDI